MAEREKLTVSKDWTEEERDRVASLLEGEIIRLGYEYGDLKQTIRWEAPVFRELDKKMDDLLQMCDFVLTAAPGFLEDNRANYKDYVL